MPDGMRPSKQCRRYALGILPVTFRSKNPPDPTPIRYGLLVQNGLGSIMGKLDGKVSIITGGSGGIGGAAARLFAAEGNRVMLNPGPPPTRPVLPRPRRSEW